MEWLQWVHGPEGPRVPVRIGVGDEVRVWYRIMEQGKERLGQFEGTVIRYHGTKESKTFTVRRVTYGEGVERIFPMDARAISRVEVLKQGKVKRGRLYFLRRKVGKTRIESVDKVLASASPANKTAETENAEAGTSTSAS